ncbi:MAG: MBL fold metallo-hydrolase [Hyphomicrobiales bacterium]|nr:MBL fold metallo-hydrolase [Hyphomicrobiales bacterium]
MAAALAAVCVVGAWFPGLPVGWQSSGLLGSQSAIAAEPGCRPDVAVFGAPVRRVSLKADEARLTFVGHATFLIESAQGISAATDYNDYVRPRGTPVIATMNKAHSTHHSRNPDSGIAHVLRGWDPAGGKAEHDVTVSDMRVRNIPTNIRSFGGATDYDGNSIFVFEVGELCIVHLGHLHHTLEPGHLRAIGRVDVLLVPVDGSYTLDSDGMFEVLKTLQARIMIPMHFFGQTTLDRFLAKAGTLWAVERRDEPVLTVSRAGLPRQPTVIVLPGR